MTGRPCLTVFVVGGAFVRLVEALHAVFGAGELGEVRPARCRVGGTERVDLELRGDVHRGHSDFAVHRVHS